jgi:hypothetical protein
MVAVPPCERQTTGTEGDARAWRKSMKRVSLGGVEMSRLVCGSNAFNARSHFSEARDAEYAARFDDETAVGGAGPGADLGLDTYENSASIGPGRP